MLFRSATDAGRRHRAASDHHRHRELLVRERPEPGQHGLHRHEHEASGEQRRALTRYQAAATSWATPASAAAPMLLPRQSPPTIAAAMSTACAARMRCTPSTSPPPSRRPISGTMPTYAAVVASTTAHGTKKLTDADSAPRIIKIGRAHV